MSIRSVFRAIGARWQGFYPWTAAGPQRPLYTQEDRNKDMRGTLDRLTSRRDWISEARPPAPYTTYRGGRNREDLQATLDQYENPGPLPLATDGDGVDLSGRGSPPWPPQDDPYARPEPCRVVPDGGKATIDRLAERGLCGPIGTNAGLENVMDLIDRQEAAEKELIFRGMVWSKENKRWIDPDTELA